MTHLLGEPMVFLAMVVMVALATMPRQHRRSQVLAILGWALIWQDNAISGHWADWLGAAVFVASLGAVLVTRRLARQSQVGQPS